MPDINGVLFVQHREVIDRQQSEVEHAIKSQLDVPVAFASSPDEVVDGEAYDVVIAPTISWLPDVLNQIPNLQWVHFLSAGVEKIWGMKFDWGSIKLSKSSGVHTAPMSEYAIGAMLYFAKEFDRFVEQSHDRIWQRAWLGELTNKNLLIVGMGSVGSAVAHKASSFGMNVIGIATKQRADSDHQIETVERLFDHLATADYVVLTLPLTSQTKGLGNDDFFNSMKPGAVLVDISRGGIIQAASLIAALERGNLRGAALDVFEEEPLAQASPLWNRADVLLTPHVSGTTPHYLSRALEIFVSNARAYRKNEALKTAVDQTIGY